MARFKIYSSGGTEKAQGCPTFTGTYMKSGVLDFREIGSPTPISWTIGDYVDYTRTGLRYYLYGIPQIKRQASNGSYGGAFVYQNVQLHDSSYDFEICPFRDLIVGDNRVHFSTQPSISVFDNVAGIAERIQACLDDMFPNKWDVRVASGTEYDTLMAEEREFSVSGVTIKGVLDKVYEVWPEVGWVFSVENGTCVLTIGGAWQNTPDTYTYGKGNGLISLSRSVANADELANRLFVFGSNRNMLPKWYNSQDIKDANSVDIQHLMLPVGPIGTPGSADYYPGWGKTDVGGVDKPDPAKAYIQDDASIAARGLRPNTVYFDGSGDYKEIYPTIREMTIGELRSAKTRYGDTSYVPAASYGDSERIDKVLAVNSTFDAGLAANNGKETVQNDYDSISVSRTATVPANSARKIEVPLFMTTFSPVETGEKNISLLYEMAGTVNLSGINSASMEVRVRRGSESGPVLLVKTVDLVKSESAADTFIIDNASFDGERINITSATLYVIATIVIDPGEATSSARTITVVDNGTLSFSMVRYRAKSFSISLRQIGFDINEQANLGDGKTISMRSGACVGRTFRIASATYIASSDTWNLEVIRSNDESLSQWFPNSSYPIAAGDEFVLLDIAMPATYVSVAEERLLTTARELLSDTAKERWQYTPDIDAKFMDVNSRSIQAGDIISITDNDIVGDDGRLLVDSVTISEGDSTIPTYKVTIRERKRKNYTDKASVPEPTSNPVTDVKSVAAVGRATNLVDTFFEEDGNGNIKLKDEYGGFWAQGFVTAGGIGSGGGGGGDITLADVWRSLTNNPQLTPSDIGNTTPINALHIPIGSGLSIDSDGNIIVTAQGTVTGVALGSGTTPYSPVNGIITLPAYPTALASPYALTVGSKTYDGSAAVTIDKSDIGLGNVTNDAQVKRTEMGAASGVATLGSDGKVPSSQLPSYVDDVLEYADLAHFPATGESGKIYVALDTNKTYRWSGTAYVEISPSIVIGTTTGTAFDGGSGYSHVTNGDIHVTATQKTNWNTAYGWGDHSQAGYFAASSFTAANIVSTLGTTAVNRATADANGNNIANTYATVASLTSKGSASVPIYFDANHAAQEITSLDLLSKTTGYVKANRYYVGSSGTGTTAWANGQYLVWDDTNKAWHLVGNFYADGFITAGGVGSGGGGGGGGLVQQIFRIGDFGGVFDTSANDTFNAYAINSLYTSIQSLNTAVNDKINRSVLWASLQNNDNVTTYDNYKFAQAHFPVIAYGGAGGANQGITLAYGANTSGSTLADTLTLAVNASVLASTLNLGGFVTLADAQTITGSKTFTSAYPILLQRDEDYIVFRDAAGTEKFDFGFYNGDTYPRLYIWDNTAYNVPFAINNGKVGINKIMADYNLEVNGTFNATTIYQNGVALGSRAFDSTAYLPLSAGSSYPITGQLYLTSIYDSKIILNNTDSSPSEIYCNVLSFQQDGVEYGKLGTVLSNRDLYWKDYTILDSGNYNSYALPLYSATPPTVSVGTGYESVIKFKSGSSGYCLIQLIDSDNVTRYIGWDSTNGMNYHDGSAWRNVWHSGNFTPSNYLPLSGGTMTGALAINPTNSAIPLSIKSSHPTDVWIELKNNSNAIFYFGYTATNGLTYQAAGTNNTIYHSGNSNLTTVPWTCSYLDTYSSYSIRIHGDERYIVHYDSNGNEKFDIGMYCGGTYPRYYVWDVTARNAAFSIYNGKVGINKAEAEYTLDVAGTARFLTNGGGVIIGASGNTIDGCYSGGYDSLHLNTVSSGNVYIGAGGGNVMVGSGTPSYKLDVSGVIHSTTGIFSDGYVTAGSASDARLKDNVRTMEFGDAMAILANARPVRFSWNGLANSLCEKYVGNDMGMIAQEVEPYIPEAISSIYGEYKRLDYTKFIAPLVCVAKSHEERLQQAEREIADLKRENAQLKARLNA